MTTKPHRSKTALHHPQASGQQKRESDCGSFSPLGCHSPLLLPRCTRMMITPSTSWSIAPPSTSIPPAKERARGAKKRKLTSASSDPRNTPPPHTTHPNTLTLGKRREQRLVVGRLRREAADEALVHADGAAQHVEVLGDRAERAGALHLDGDVLAVVRARAVHLCCFFVCVLWLFFVLVLYLFLCVS